MSNNPTRIARIGLAIEFADGQRVMIYSEDPAEVTLNTEYDYEQGWDGRLSRPTSSTSIEIDRLSNYTVYYGQAETDLILNQTQKQIGGKA